MGEVAEITSRMESATVHSALETTSTEFSSSASASVSKSVKASSNSQEVVATSSTRGGLVRQNTFTKDPGTPAIRPLSTEANQARLVTTASTGETVAINAFSQDRVSLVGEGLSGEEVRVEILTIR